MIDYVYILRCKDGSYYVGSTHDVAARVLRHNEGRAATYTAIRRPVILIYTEEHPSQPTCGRDLHALALFAPQIIQFTLRISVFFGRARFYPQVISP